MTQVTVAETIYSVTVSEDNYTVTVADSQETINVQIASAAADTQVNSGGTGTSLIYASTGGITTLKSVAGGDNVTLTDDGNGTITISATEDDLSNNTTDNLSEGTTNQYFTDARVMTALETVSGHVVPSANVTYDLGSTTNMWRDVYVGPGSLYVNGQKVISSQTGRIDITTDPNETLNIQSGGSLSMLSANEVTSLTDATINLGPSVNNGTINVRGTLDVVNKIEMGDLDLTSGLIHQDSGTNLVLRTNSGHNIVADTDVLLVGATDGANTQITPTGVTGTVSSIANHDTDALSEGSNNLYHTTARVQSVIDTNTAGYITDYTVTQADVTQHQSALSITQSQISDLDHYNSTDFSTDFATKSTTDLSEGTNLYYTDARADARAQLKIDALVDSAPGTLDTLNELAAALGDDANFSTTVTNSIATKLASADFDSTFDTRLATKDTNDISEGSSNLYYTDARFNTAFSGKSTTDLSEGTNLYYTDARFDTRLATKDTGDLTEGSNLYYTDARARSAISLSSSNTNELSYDSSTGVITYTSPSTVAASGQIVFDVRNASGVDIARGDAVYISGHSGSKILVAKADANVASTMPAIGLANSAMSNNSDGSVLVGGEMTSLDTSAFSVGDVLYVSETSGELTATRPTASTTKIQNIGKVARSDNQNGIIIVVGSGRANDVPNLSSGHVFIGDGAGYETRALDTDDVAEAGNLYYTDARFNTAFSGKSTTDLSEGTNQYFTNARAISAVEGESTVDLTGALTVDGQISTDSVVKVNDGFVLTSFNPYGVGNNMPTTLMGVGQEEGWAAMNIRSRGEHDFGLGAPYNLAPRGLLNLQSGRLDGSDNDTGLSNNDSFGAVLWSPYSSYRTGVEWLTPSASIYGIATQDHSESNGFGTKLEFSTTENDSKAGAADLAHTNKSIVFQGTTITTSDTLKIDDDLQVTGNIGNNGSAVDFDDNIKITGNVSTKTTTIGDFDSSGSPAYAFSGIQLDAGDTAWPTVVFKEYAGTDGGGNKPVNLFTNPGFETEVFGGTPSSPAALGASKRILAVNGNAANGATLPGLANIRFLGQTVGVQSGSNRGSEFIFQTTPENSTTIRETLKLINGNIVQIGESGYDSGHAIIRANGGDVKIDDNLQVNDNLTVSDNLTVNGNTVLGNDTSIDTVTVNAKLTTNAGLVLTSMDTATANYLAGLGAIDEGSIIYCTDGDSGNKALAVYDGSNWKRVSLGANISSS
jgi:co-chaperonin GroES (HSP10)